MSEPADFEGLSLAQLHEAAAAAGIEGFRKMRREDLAVALADAGATAPYPRPRAKQAQGSRGGGGGGGRESSGGRKRSRRSRGGRDRSRGGKDRDRSGGGDRDGAAGFEADQITGTLDILPRGNGLIRGKGIPESGVYVSPSQIRRCELRKGDEVSGPVRAPKKGERRPSLTRVELVNGKPPDEGRSASFERLTPVEPHRRIPLKPDPDDAWSGAVDRIAPLAFGQRILVEAEPRSGRTRLLRSLARSIRSGSDRPPELTVLLVDERPEEVTAWERETEGLSIEAAPADLGAREQSRVAERALSQVRRQAEKGKDVILMIDSLTRLANALGDPGQVKPFFGTGRELEEKGSGSVTVIATVLIDGDPEVLDAVRTTENSTIRLSAALASAGVFPSIEGAGASPGQETRTEQKKKGGWSLFRGGK